MRSGFRRKTAASKAGVVRKRSRCSTLVWPWHVRRSGRVTARSRERRDEDPRVRTPQLSLHRHVIAGSPGARHVVHGVRLARDRPAGLAPVRARLLDRDWLHRRAAGPPAWGGRALTSSLSAHPGGRSGRPRAGHPGPPWSPPASRRRGRVGRHPTRPTGISRRPQPTPPLQRCRGRDRQVIPATANASRFGPVPCTESVLYTRSRIASGITPRTMGSIGCRLSRLSNWLPPPAAPIRGTPSRLTKRATKSA